MCRYDIYKLSRALTSTQNFSFRLFSLSFFLFFFFILPLFFYQFSLSNTNGDDLRAARRRSVRVPPPCVGAPCWADGTGGRELRPSVLLPFYLFHLPLSMSFCELGAAWCRVAARFAEEEEEKLKTQHQHEPDNLLASSSASFQTGGNTRWRCLPLSSSCCSCSDLLTRLFVDQLDVFC